MRTSAFNGSFFQYKPADSTPTPSSNSAGPSTSTPAPSSDRAGPSNSTLVSREPTLREEKNYSSAEHGAMDSFFNHGDFNTFKEQYTKVLDNIVAFVSNHDDMIERLLLEHAKKEVKEDFDVLKDKTPLLEQSKEKVKKDFDVLKKHLFENNGGYFIQENGTDHRPVMYGMVKKMLHEFSRMLENEAIPLQERVNAVLALSGRARVCSGGLGSDLEETVRTLKLSNSGFKGAAYKWKIKMMEELIRQHVCAKHGDTGGNEIHYVQAYYNHLADEMGVEKRTDRYADNLVRNGRITRETLLSCRQNVLQKLKPMALVDDMASQFLSRIEASFKPNKIDPANVSFGEVQKLESVLKAELDPEYGTVSPHAFLEQKDPNDYGSPYVYNGKKWPTGLMLHFTKDLKKEKWINYNDSRIVLGDTSEGRIKMRGNMLWMKETVKGSSHQRPTVQAWSEINPEELFDIIKKAESGNMGARVALVNSIVEHVRNLPQAEEAGTVLGTWLMHATGKGEIGMLKTLLKAGVGAESKDNEGRTTLMHAAGKNQVGALNTLLKAGAQLEARDNQGRTALMHAVINGQVGAVKALLKTGARLEAKDNQGRTALMHAAINGQAEMLEVLLKKGAKKKTTDNEGKTAQMHAAEQAARQGEGNAPALRVFTEAAGKSVWNSVFGKKKLDAAQEAGIVALDAVERGDLDELKTLIDNGANIKVKDKHGNNAAMLAAKNGHGSLLRALIYYGVNIHAENKHGDNAVMLATMNGHADVLRVLIENGADFEAKHNGTTPLVLAAKKDRAGALQVLIENGVDFEEKHKGATPLVHATKNGSADALQVLIENGVDLEARYKGVTPLILAVKKGHPDALRVLINNGANIEATYTSPTSWTKAAEKEMNATMLAARNADVNSLRILLQHDANPNAKDKDGITPLMFAAWAGPEINRRTEDVTTALRLLLDKGANINAQDERDRWTPLMYAIKERNVEAVRLLLDRGADINIRNRNGYTANRMVETMEGYNRTAILRLFKEYERASNAQSS